MKLTKYKHLSFEDRCTIQEYLNYGYNIRILNKKRVLTCLQVIKKCIIQLNQWTLLQEKDWIWFIWHLNQV